MLQRKNEVANGTLGDEVAELEGAGEDQVVDETVDTEATEPAVQIEPDSYQKKRHSLQGSCGPLALSAS